MERKRVEDIKEGGWKRKGGGNAQEHKFVAANAVWQKANSLCRLNEKLTILIHIQCIGKHIGIWLTPTALYLPIKSYIYT